MSLPPIKLDAPVIQLRPRRPDRFPVHTGRTRDTKKSACMHSQTLVDRRNRTVECATCGADVDVFSVLDEIARSGDWVLAMRAEKKELQTEIEALKRERSNLRASVRAAKKRKAAT